MAIKTHFISVRYSLLSKIFSVFSLLTAFIFVLLCALYILIEIKEKKAHLTESLNQETRNLVELIRLPLFAENKDQLLQEAENSFRQSGMTAVIITSVHGKILVNLHKPGFQNADEIISETLGVYGGKQTATIEETLINTPNPRSVLMGSVRLERSTADLSSDVRQFIMYSAGLALFCWLVMLGVFYLILRKFTVSFNELMHGLNQMRNGDYNARIRIMSRDEPGRAGLALNELAEKLKSREEENLRLNRDLRESEKNLKTLLDTNERDIQIRLSMASAAALLFAWDINLMTGAITYSDSVESAFGNMTLDADFYELNKLTLQIHDKDRNDVTNLYKRAIHQNGLFDGQFRIKGDKDVYIWIEAHGKVIRNAQSEPVRMVGIGQNITGRKQFEEAQRRVNTLAQDLALSEERERCRIAEELHDQVGPNLLLCMMKLDSLRSQLPVDNHDEFIEPIESIIENSIQEIRSLTFQLRPPILTTAGLTPALKWLASEYLEKYGLNITITDNANPSMMDFDIRSTLFQVMRELLYNIVKHAGTNQAAIMLEREVSLISVKVTDKGVGFDPVSKLVPKSDSMGFGMFNIRQKIEHIGGSIQFDSAPGNGTLVTIFVPEHYVHENTGEPT
jgi:signal transduction histidine kinase